MISTTRSCCAYGHGRVLRESLFIHAGSLNNDVGGAVTNPAESSPAGQELLWYLLTQPNLYGVKGTASTGLPFQGSQSSILDGELNL
jgi:hypothetical protein